MKQKTILTLMLMFALLVFPMVSADVIIPTKTNVYFEQNGQAYNGNVEFTVKGYGYATGMPGEPDFNPDREPGTYTPEVVYSFSAVYNNYGDEIDENYYRNYVHIDYYEVEGKTAYGKTFIIKNLKSIPTSCVDNNPEENEEYQTCLANLEKPNFVGPSTQSAGATREDYEGRIWTKGEDGMWTSPSAPGTSWGDIIWAETDKEVYAYNEAKNQCEDILNNMYDSEDYYEQECELRFNLDDATWSEAPEPQGFWSKIGCFFKRLFGGSC